MTTNRSDIHALPRWQKVARAAANARAVLHRFTEHWPGADEDMRILEQTIEFAERAAAKGECDWLDASVAAMEAEKIAAEVATPKVVAAIGQNASVSASYVASAASKAAHAACSAAVAEVAERADKCLTEHVVESEAMAGKAR